MSKVLTYAKLAMRFAKGILSFKKSVYDLSFVFVPKDNTVHRYAVAFGYNCIDSPEYRLINKVGSVSRLGTFRRWSDFYYEQIPYLNGL